MEATAKAITVDQWAAVTLAVVAALAVAVVAEGIKKVGMPDNIVYVFQLFVISRPNEHLEENLCTD